MEYKFNILTTGYGVCPENIIIGNVNIKSKETDIEKIKELCIDNIIKSMQIVVDMPNAFTGYRTSNRMIRLELS